MKRKIKLIISIASLTLSMALVMFGVYAAATARQTEITGTITFTTTNVRATVAVYEYTGTTAPDPLGVNNLAGEKQFLYGTEGQEGATITLGTKVGGTGGNIPMSESVTTYNFVVKITNDFTSGNITVSLPTISGVSGVITVTPTVDSTTIAAGETNTYSYKFTLDPSAPTESSISLPISAVFELTVAAA